MEFDVNKYDEIVRKYQSIIFNYANYHLYNNKQYADEVTNDVFLVLFKKWSKVAHIDINHDPHNQMKAWLYNVAEKEVKNCIRKNLKYLANVTSLDDYFPSDDEKHYMTEKYISGIKDKLNDEQRLIFKHYIVDEKSIVDVSKLLDMPHSTVRYKIAKIKKIAQKVINDIESNSIN